LEVVCSGGTSFGLVILEEVKSSRRFRFLSEPWTSDSAGGGDKVESLSFIEPLAPSPSRFSKASGASESAGATSAAMGPSSGGGGREARNW
jgi:hypothetical protein